MSGKSKSGGAPFPHPPGSPFRADYVPQMDWSDMSTRSKYGHEPADGCQAKFGYRNGTIPGLSVKHDPTRAARIRKASALG